MSEDLFRSFEEQFGDTEVGEVECMASLTNMDLLLRLESIDGELYQINELMHPQTQVGRDWHSQRGAVVVELHRRHLM